VAIARLATRQHGLVTLAQLRGLGLGDRAVQQRAARGKLHRLHRGVYAVGHSVLSHDGCWLGAVLACGPDAVLSHRSAAAAWGIRRSDRTRIDVTTPRRGRTAPPGVQIHRVRSLASDDVTHHRGIPITTVARTLVDLADVLELHALERAVHESEVLRLLDMRAVDDTLTRANGRRGVTPLRAALAEPPVGPTRSALEDRFLALVRSAALPLRRLNSSIALGDRRFEVDCLWPSERVVVELDGEDVHLTRRAFQSDRVKDLALAADGYVVVRLTWQQVTRAGNRVVDQLSRLVALR
jgi:very-short-patch-repair endonuclease